MSVIIDGTNGISDVDGSASTPAIRGTDANTGIFFPAADTIAFAEGGAEAMRINSSGNVGIGTSSPAAPLTIVRDHVSSNGTLKIQTVTSFASGGLSSIDLSDSDGTRKGFVYQDSTGFAIETASSLPITFRAGGGERARITSGGEVYIAGTTDQGAYNLQCNGTGVWGAGAYVNGSDERIKDDIAPIDSGLDVVEKLNPVTYRYKEDWSKDQSTQTGFIAQELLVALEGKNYVDGVVQQGGAEGYYSVAYQNIIPILTKAIQELNAKIETLEAQNAAFEARLAALEAK